MRIIISTIIIVMIVNLLITYISTIRFIHFCNMIAMRGRE